MLQLRLGYKFNYQGSEDEKIDEVDGTAFGSSRTEEGLTAGLGFNLVWLAMMPRLTVPLPRLALSTACINSRLSFSFKSE